MRGINRIVGGLYAMKGYLPNDVHLWARHEREDPLHPFAIDGPVQSAIAASRDARSVVVLSDITGPLVLTARRDMNVEVVDPPTGEVRVRTRLTKETASPSIRRPPTSCSLRSRHIACSASSCGSPSTSRLLGMAVSRLEGRFYPEDLQQSRWLEYYARTFDTVEINNSFYKLPTREAVVGWRSRAPRGFLFAVKASRYLTHLRKLKDPADPLDLFFDRARLLQRHLGPVLYQLPPRWRSDHKRLQTFLGEIPRDVRQVIEFREPDWYARDVRCARASRSRVMPARYARLRATPDRRRSVRLCSVPRRNREVPDVQRRATLRMG